MKFMLVVQLAVIILVLFIVYKILQLFGGLTKVIHQIFTKAVPPIKRFILFELKIIKVIIKNLTYNQNELYPSLKNNNFVGVIYKVNLPRIQKNPILISIVLVSLQLFIVEYFLNKDFIKGNLVELKNTIISIIVGLVIAIVYVAFKRNKVKPNSNIFMKSSLGSIIEPIRINPVTPMQINALLTTGNFKTTQEVNYSIKARESSYPLMHEYFCQLQGNKSKESVYNAFIEVFSYLYHNREVKASLVELGHGGSTVFHHSLHVAEYGLSLFSNDVYKQYEDLVKERLVFACLGHDLGKIRCYNEDKPNYNGHEQLSYFILGQLYYFNQLDSELRDDVLHLTNNQSKTFVEESEVLVVANHMFKTADTKASELEGMQMSEDRILSIYRISFYDLLRDKTSIARCGTLVDGYIYLSVNEFVKEIIKLTKQTFTVENYANTGVFKQISKLFMLDGLYAKGFENVLCHIVFLDKASNREIKRYTQCIILRYDVIVDNQSIKSDVIVGLQAKDSIAKLVIKDGQLIYDSSIKNTDVKKIDTPYVEPVKVEPVFLEDKSQDDVPPYPSDDGDDIPQPNDIPQYPINNIPDQPPYIQEPITQLPTKTKNNGRYKKITLSELENIYLEKLRAVGFIVNKIEFETNNFIRCPVHGKNFPAGSYKAFVKGVPNLHYIVYKTKTFEQGHDNIEFKENYKLSGYSYDGLLQEFEKKKQDDEFKIQDLQSKLATLQEILSESGDNKIFNKLNIDEKKIIEIFNNKCYKENLFTVLVDNFDSGKHSGYIQIATNNDEIIEYPNDKLIQSSSNYILISKIKEIANLSSIILVDNLSDALFLYSNLELPVLVYFDLDITIEKINEICNIPKIIATNFLDFEHELNIAEGHNCQIINPFGLFDSSHKDLISNDYMSGQPINYFRCSYIYKKEINRYINEINKQLEFNQLESITNANRLFNFYKDKFVAA